MTNCCYQHDICYNNCGMKKEKCDNEFLKCLYDYCNSLGRGTIIEGDNELRNIPFTLLLFFSVQKFCQAFIKNTDLRL